MVNSILGTLKARLQYLAARQEVVAGNVANVYKPGFKPQDLKPFKEVMRNRGGSTLALTQASGGHLPGGKATYAGGFPLEDRYDLKNTSFNGNGISIEEQMEMSTETVLSLKEALAVQERYLKMRRTALGKQT